MGILIETSYLGISFSISSLITFLWSGFCHYETSYMVYSDRCYEVTWDEQNEVSICCSSCFWLLALSFIILRWLTATNI